jgi:hypothetical protein
METRANITSKQHPLHPSPQLTRKQNAFSSAPKNVMAGHGLRLSRSFVSEPTLRPSSLLPYQNALVWWLLSQKKNKRPNRHQRPNQPRFGRRWIPTTDMAIILTQRDIEIFSTLWSARYMNAPQIQRLFWRESRGGAFGQLKACQRRLRMLTQHQLLRRIDLPVRRGEAPPPYIYALDKAGAEVLSQEVGVSLDEIGWKPTDAEENDIFLKHLLATNEVRIALTLACEQHGYSLETWLDEKELRSEGMYDRVTLVDAQGGQERVAVIPDGFFVIKSERRLARFVWR